MFKIYEEKEIYRNKILKKLKKYMNIKISTIVFKDLD